MRQSGSGIDVHRCADNHQNICFADDLGGRANHRDALTEKHDEGAQQRTVASLFAIGHFAVVLRQFAHITLVELVVGRADFRQFAMQVNHALRTCLFVQIIDVLRHHCHVEIVL